MSWLGPEAEDRERVAKLRAQEPAPSPLYRLAAALSPALRIEPLLLRNARLRFVPESDAGLEARLWFSDLVSSRSATRVVLRPGVARALCDALEHAPLAASFQEHLDFVDGHTRHWDELDRLEQRLRLAAREHDTARLSAELKDVLARLAAETDARARRDIARWARGALPQIAAADGAPDEAQWLHQYSAAALGDAGAVAVSSDALAAPLPAWLAAEVPPARRPVAVAVELREGELHCLKPQDGGHALPLSTPLPAPARLHVEPDGLAPTRDVRLAPGVRVPLPPACTAVVIEAAGGQRWRLRALSGAVGGDAGARGGGAKSGAMETPETDAATEAAAEAGAESKSRAGTQAGEAERAPEAGATSKAQTAAPRPLTEPALLVHVPEDALLAQRLAEQLEGIGVPVELRDDRGPSEDAYHAMSETRPLLRLWSRAAARRWQGMPESMAHSPAVLLRGDETDAPPGNGTGPVIDVAYWDGDPESEEARLLLGAVTELRGGTAAAQSDGETIAGPDGGSAAAQEAQPKDTSAETPGANAAPGGASAETPDVGGGTAGAFVEASTAAAEPKHASAETPDAASGAQDHPTETPAPATEPENTPAETPDAATGEAPRAGAHLYLLAGSTDGSAAEAMAWLARHLPRLGYRAWPGGDVATDPKVAMSLLTDFEARRDALERASAVLYLVRPEGPPGEMAHVELARAAELALPVVPVLSPTVGPDPALPEGLARVEPLTLEPGAEDPQRQLAALDGALQRLGLTPDPEVLLEVVDDAYTEPPTRLAIGDRLAAVGDPRPGVGLDADGVPDIDWVEVPAGAFLFQEGETRELPAFRIARYAVTNAQFQAFIDDGGYGDKRWWEGLAQQVEKPEAPRGSQANRPRENVSWYEAVAFCRWLTSKLGVAVRLPVEQEWEKAARGEKGLEYPWGNEYRSGYANVDEKERKDGPWFLQETTAMGMYPQGASPYGILDLSGNVWEWCLNVHEEPNADAESVDLRSNAARVLRGGSWILDPDYARASNRNWDAPGDRDDLRGLRVLCASPLRPDL